MSEAVRYTDYRSVREFVGHEAITCPMSVMEHHDVPFDTDSESLEGQQKLHIAVARAEGATSTIIVPVSWSDWGTRPFHEARLKTMSAYSGADVAGIDFPGMGDVSGGRGKELTEKQVEELRMGRMEDLATKSWRGLESVGALGEPGNRRTAVLWLHSMSALSGSEMAASDAKPSDVKIQDLYISEDMALRKMNTAHFALRFLIKGGKHLSDYDQLNVGMPEVEHSGIGALVGQVSKQLQSHALSVKALSKGRQLEIVASAYDKSNLDSDPEHGTRLHTVRATDGLTREKDVEGFVKSLLHIGALRSRLIRKDTLQGEGHGWQDGLPAVLEQMSHLAIVEASA